MSEALNAEAVLASIVELREQGRRVDIVCEKLDENNRVVGLLTNKFTFCNNRT